jgi:hypothetical protein|tara:strand:+ start:162 stop:293 length:132 start_codon:yes stop_codon:yes gene_type:complete
MTTNEWLMKILEELREQTKILATIKEEINKVGREVQKQGGDYS